MNNISGGSYASYVAGYTYTASGLNKTEKKEYENFPDDFETNMKVLDFYQNYGMKILILLQKYFLILIRYLI